MFSPWIAGVGNISPFILGSTLFIGSRDNKITLNFFCVKF